MTEPGWYTDDEDPSLARWHDGTGWTHHTVQKPDPTKAAVPGAPTQEARVPWGSPDPVAPPQPEPVAEPAPAPSPDPRPEVRPDPRPTPRPAPVPPAAKPKKPGPPTKQPSRPRWQLLVLIVAVVVVGLVVRQVVSGGGGSSDLLKSDLQSYGADFTTIDGSSYRLTIVPSSEELDEASPGGCFDAPKSGHANFGFAVRVENRSDKAAPMPDVTFAVNATEDGNLDLSPESLSGANRQVELTPAAKGATCSDASSIRPVGRAKLGKGESVTFKGIVGGIVTPSSGLSLIVRYVQGDPVNPTVSSTADILAPFPPAPKK